MFEVIARDAVPSAGGALSVDSAARERVRAEFREMPGLRLTLTQAARLFGLEVGRCAEVLHALVGDGTLWSNGREFMSANAGRRCA